MACITALRATLSTQASSDPLCVRMSIGLAQVSFNDNLSDLLRSADHAVVAEKPLHHLEAGHADSIY